MGSMADYGDLKRVILGVAENYLPHVWGWKTEGATKESFKNATSLATEVIPRQVREEVIEDLESYSTFFQEVGIEVLRPPRNEYLETTETSNYFSFGNDFYNMRDLQIVLGKTLLTAAPSCPSRVEELKRLKPFLSEAAKDAKLRLNRAPIPYLKRNPVQEFLFDGMSLVPREYVEGEKLGGDYEKVWHRLTEDEVLFDAANIARFHNQILYLVSSTGNERAFDWILGELDEDYHSSLTDVYRSSHIDSTIVPLSESTVLVNGARVNATNLPSALKGKKILYFEAVAPIPQSEREFHNLRKKAGQEIKSLGLHSNLLEMSSPWAGLNVLVVKENLIAVESRQEALMLFLESEGFNVQPIRLRHPYTFLGGLHCTTLDLIRDI